MTNGFSAKKKIKRWFSVGKIIVLGLLGFLVLVTAVILNTSDLWDKFFLSRDVVFKTTDIFPDLNNRPYPFCILTGGEIVPVANPVPDEDKPAEVSGPPNNITFTLTNNTERELLVDKIEAVLTEYQNMPEKCIYTSGPFAVLRPIDLLLVLSPEQDKYNLSADRYVAISSGKTEHVFRVWVAGKKPGIYRFKINIMYRIGGELERVVESDAIYSFAVPDSTCAEGFFLYRGEKSDPNFQDLVNIVNKPLDEFKQITSGWGEYKLLDPIHNAPEGLREFIGFFAPSRAYSVSGQVSQELITTDAEELVLSVNDLTLEWSRLSIIESEKDLDISGEQLPSWILKTPSSEISNSVLSAYSVKYSIRSPSIEVIYNTVAVYPTIDLAHQAYLGLQPTDRQIYRMANAEIGDEYFMAMGTSTKDSMTILVFRKKNVVVSIVSMPGSPFFDAYARRIAHKI